MTKRLTSCLSMMGVCLAMLFALAALALAPVGKACADEPAGAAEGGETVEVSSVAELSAVSDRVAAGDAMTGVKVLLTSDIDMKGVNFEPIGIPRSAGTSGVPFAGIFDGQGHSLKNLTVYTTMSETHVHQWHALFGACDGATVKDLVIDGCSVETTSMVSSYACVLCPEAANSTIENVTLKGALKCAAGMVINASNTVFKGCVLDYTESTLSSGIVKNAKDGCVIEGCTAKGALSSQVSAGAGLGAMANSLSDSTIRSCTNEAAIVGGMNEAGYLGSIVGYAKNSTVEDCVNTGKVTLTNQGSLNNLEPVGGYAAGIAGGLERSTVQRCLNYADIDNICIQQGRQADPQTEYPAGIVSVAIKASRIENCVSTGDINIDLLGYNLCYSNVGGLVAQLRGSTLSNCYNTGNMKAKLTTYFNSAKPMKIQFKGSGIASIIDDEAAVENSYNTGTIDYEILKDSSLESAVDAVSLNCKGALSGVYYYRGSWPIESELGEALTATNMKEQASFAGYDFEETWTMDQSAFALPVLKIEGPVERTALPDDVDFSAAQVGSVSAATYNGQAQEPTPKVKLDGKTLKKDVDYQLSYSKNVNAGKAKLVAKGLGRYVGKTNATFTINKAKNAITLKKAKATFKASDLKKRAKAFSIGAKANTKVKYTLSSAAKKAKIKVSSKGRVTIKKKTKKGTYKITVSAPASGNYKAASKKTVTIKVTGK